MSITSSIGKRPRSGFALYGVALAWDKEGERVQAAKAYGDFLDAISNPKNPNHEDMVEWIGGDFDPEAFDVEAVNKELQRLR